MVCVQGDAIKSSGFRTQGTFNDNGLEIKKKSKDISLESWIQILRRNMNCLSSYLHCLMLSLVMMDVWHDNNTSDQFCYAGCKDSGNLHDPLRRNRKF